MSWLKYASISTCVLAVTLAFPNGAPEFACEEMIPGHLPSTVSDPSPFSFSINATSYTPGQKIMGTLTSADSQLKGFLIEVGTASAIPAREKAVGVFTKMGDEQKLVCKDAGITHVNNKEKTSVTFEWTAPSTSQGDLYFRATVVQQFIPSKYYQGIFSSPLSAA